MILEPNLAKVFLQSSLSTHSKLTISHRRALRGREPRAWKHRRLKFCGTVTAFNQLGPLQFGRWFQDLLSQFPSVNSLDIFAPALGFASGVALQFFRSSRRPSPVVSDAGEWILFTSPTPFNGFVMLRCPSLGMEGSELLEDVNERLMKEDGNFVRLNRGRIKVGDAGDWTSVEKLVYQRVCISTDDGGVIALDWPANLDLEEEHGLDTMVLLVPGTTDGSMDNNVRSFVYESLKRGCFPIVMNPRGCAGSPLTTPRLFTAADSDDISTAVQYITNVRPWTTLTSIGWGFGANMLTKYLAEAGERTPLTAATCIDNPFDLEEVTKSSTYDISINKKLTGGLIDILLSNKELFQGRAKGFNIGKALSATSVRDFEEVISMISYGFSSIEDFYANSSTHDVIGKLKIPVLFIQNDDRAVPAFSNPRNSIAENPFTSLLLCSYLQSNSAIGRSSVSWCQHLAFEWLTAVELGLLKGRHPLLKDVDVAVNPSNGLAFWEQSASKRSHNAKRLLRAHHSDVLHRHSLDVLNLDKGNGTTKTDHAGQNPERALELTGSDEQDNGSMQHENTVDVDLVKPEGAGTADSEQGQVLQTAELIMNMLDVTMPGTLEEEQRKKVLYAVGEGEMVMKALQDAVPEDVRAKLAESVSEMLHKQEHKLKLDGILNMSKIPDVASGLKSKFGEKIGQACAEVGKNDPHSTQQMKRASDTAGVSVKNHTDVDKHIGDPGSDTKVSEDLQRTSGIGHGIDATSYGKKGLSESVNVHEDAGLFGETDSQPSESKGSVPKSDIKPDLAGPPEITSDKDGKINDRPKEVKDGETSRSDIKEESINQNLEERNSNSSTDQNKNAISVTQVGLPPQDSFSEAHLSEKEESDNQKREEKIVQPVLNQKSCSSPSFSVSQALHALTEFDDSTQFAVNSVFNVIEDMITRLEVGSDPKIEGVDENVDEDCESGFNQNNVDEMKLEDEGENSIDTNFSSEHLHNLPSDSHLEAENNLKVSRIAETLLQRPLGNEMWSHLVESTRKGQHMIIRKASPIGLNLHKYVKTKLNHNPLYIIRRYPCEDPGSNVVSNVKNNGSLDLDTTTALFLDYIPEEGQWKLLDERGLAKDPGDFDGIWEHDKKHGQTNMSTGGEYTTNTIETSYVILDDEKQEEADESYELKSQITERVNVGGESLTKLMVSVKKAVLDSLKVEVGRRLGEAKMEDMESILTSDFNQIADVMAVAVLDSLKVEHKEHTLGKINTLCIVKAISLSVQDTRYLKRILPVGVIVGSSLAAFREGFSVITMDVDGQVQDVATSKPISSFVEGKCIRANEIDSNKNSHDTGNQKDESNGLIGKCKDEAELRGPNHEVVMVGAVTAAVGASAFLAHQQSGATLGTSSKSVDSKESHQKGPSKLEEITEKSENNILLSFTEKAMSVASPVVPTKEGGEVDQERLVAMLAELSQKGGILKLIGKIALLWGGIHSAMSLTSKLISFLHIAERPLFQRVLGFACMVLVLWSPVVVPLLPTLVQSWSSHSSSKVAEFASIFGLYTSIMMLVTLWGEKIRGYANPLQQYGLDCSSSLELQNFLRGLAGGIILVFLISYINALLGCVHLSWPLSFPNVPVNASTWLRAHCNIMLIVVQGFLSASGVALVEELLFRSWLTDEIASDLGYHRAILISGLAFALFQGPSAIPALLLLSLALSGIRKRFHGSLSLPIGLRAGILATNFVLQRGGFLIYHSNSLMWVSGNSVMQSFSGAVGLAVSLILAVIFYPWPPLYKEKKMKRIIRE